MGGVDLKKNLIFISFSIAFVTLIVIGGAYAQTAPEMQVRKQQKAANTNVGQQSSKAAPKAAGPSLVDLQGNPLMSVPQKPKLRSCL